MSESVHVYECLGVCEWSYLTTLVGTTYPHIVKHENVTLLGPINSNAFFRMFLELGLQLVLGLEYTKG